MKRKPAMKLSAYLLYGLVLTVVLVLWKFPYGSLQERLEAAAADRLGIRLEIAEFSPSFPPGFTFSRCSVGSLRSEGPPFFEAVRGEVRLMILPLFKGGLALALRSSAYEGSFNANLLLRPFYNIRSYQLAVDWRAIRLEHNPAVMRLVGRNISGKLSGELRLAGLSKESTRSIGEGKIVLEGGSCFVDLPYLKPGKITELQIAAAVSLKDGKLRIKSCRFSGRGLQGTMKGVIKLRPELSESILNLAGQGQIDAALLRLPTFADKTAAVSFNSDKPLPFRLQGTLAAPRFRLF